MISILLHDWALATDTPDTMLRSLLSDDRKAFDLVDHHVLMDEIGRLGRPDCIVSWIAALLQNR